MSYSLSCILLSCMPMFLLACFSLPLRAYIVRSAILTKNHVYSHSYNTTNLPTLTFYYDVHYAHQKISCDQAQALSSAQLGGFKIIEAPIGAYRTLFMLIDQLIEEIIAVSNFFLSPSDLGTLNLREDQLLKTRAQLDTLLLPVFANIWCTTHNTHFTNSYKNHPYCIYCIDNRLSLLIIYELIDLLVILKSYSIFNKPQVEFPLSQEIIKRIISLNLSTKTVFDLTNIVLAQALQACDILIKELNSTYNKQRITAFAQELSSYQETHKKAYQFLSGVNNNYKPFFMLLIERIDKFAPFTETSLLPILGSNYTKFIDWFSSSSTRLMLLDVILLELIINTNSSYLTRAPDWQIVVGASHAENVIGFLLKEGYKISYDTAYTLKSNKSKSTSLPVGSLENTLDPLELDSIFL